MLFSGSKTIPLNFNGWGNVINGSVHTNAKMIVDTLVTINGAAEASNGFAISYDPQFVCTNRIPNAPIIEMSTFNYVFPSAVPAAPTGVTWTTANPGWQGSGDYVISSPIYFDGDFEADCGGQVRITGNGCVIATGNVTLGGTTIDTNNSVAIQSLNGSVLFTETSQMTGGSGSIIAKGDVTFRGSPFTLSTGNLVAVRSVTGAVTCNSTLTLQGNGCIVAYQDINLKGGTVSIATATHPDLYSETGDINFNNTSIITGIIYAPKGQIYISGSNCTITGSLIADHFNLTNLIAGTAAEFDPYTEGGGSTERKIRLVE